MGVGFERPLFFILGCGSIPLIIFLSRLFKNVLTLDIPLGPPGGIPFKAPPGAAFLLRALFVLELCGVFLLFAAAAGPRFTSTRTVWLNRGADILFVIDISPSMAGLDMDGQSRFDAARKLVIEFAERQPACALGLAAVGSEASLLLPPTVDREILFTRLNALRIGELGDGTALGLGLAIGALHIRRSATPRRAVVLITDGENNTGSVHPETAAAALRTLGASLWVIGVGSGGEVPIDYVDPRTGNRRTGAFDSRFDTESLRAIAREAGGTYIAAPSFSSFAEAFRRMAEGEMTIGHSGTLTRVRAFHGPLVIAALCLLAAARFVRRYVLGAFI
ncbi:MAG: VWA domain-containing protein [Spirochaetaceae bacterium]|jgi:Ca-activated chloride channel family protein|nr:VWA domain-containing protein [Spirochaetaceae bacterium]